MSRIDYVNWPETQKTFGYEMRKFKPSDKVIINCSACNCNIICSYGGIRLTKNGAPYIPVCKSCQQKRTWATNQEFRETVSKANSESMKKVWERDEYKENQSAKHVESTKKLWENPEYRTNVVNGVKNAHATIEGYTKKATQFERTEEIRKQISERSKKLWQNEEYRKNKVNCYINMWKKDREKFLKIFRSEEYRKKASIIGKKLWENPEYATKCLNNHSSKLEEHLSELLTNLDIKFTRQFRHKIY